MRGIFEVHVVGKGEYGPFKAEKEGDPDTYWPYVVVSSADGEGDPVKASYAPDLKYEPELFKPLRVVLEFHGQGKCRFHGPATAAADLKAA